MNIKGSRLLGAFLMLLALSTIEIEMKSTHCRQKFRDEDFLYCTKFGMPEIGKATANIRTRFMNTHRKSEDTIEIEVGIFKDSDWDEIADSKKIACDVKK